MQLSVLTFNIFHDVNAGTENVIYKRAVHQCKALISMRPDVLCLQEIFDSGVKDLYREMLSDFYLAYDCPERKSSALFCFSKILLVQFIYILLPTILLITWIMLLPLTSISIFFDIISFDDLRTLGIVFATTYFLWKWFLTSKWKTVVTWIEEDSLGLMILLSKTKFERIQENEPNWFLFQCQKGDLLNIIRPRGAMSITGILKPNNDDTTNNDLKVQIVNSHLNTGTSNDDRIYQIKEIMSNFPLQSDVPMILCMDSNAHETEPEMKWLFNPNEAGFIDTWRVCHQWDDVSKSVDRNQFKTDAEWKKKVHREYEGYTWDAQNPLTRTQLIEPDQRVDYVCIKYQENSAIKLDPIRSELAFNYSPYLSDHFGVLSTIEIVCDS